MSMKPVIEHYIETLNRENGAVLFEKLAASLAEKEICSNILPSTGPFGGGDKGVDLRTHKTYLLESSGIFRLYSSSQKSPTDKRIIFAFSIDKKWNPKIEKDVKKIIVTNKLKPEAIYYITNQFIKTKEREEKIADLKSKYPKIDFDIFDGSWLVKHLSGEHYVLMVQYCQFPGQLDPRIEELYDRLYSFRETGMSDAESVKIKELTERVGYRSNYEGILEQRVSDLLEIANIYSKFTAYIEESVKFYDEALTEVNAVEDASLVSELYYDNMKALQKLRLYNKIAELLPEYRQYLLDKNRPQDFRYIFTWLMYLLPHQDVVTAINLTNFAEDSLKEFEERKPKNVARHVTAFYEEGLVQGRQLLSMLGAKDFDPIELWKEHIDKNKEITLYPIYQVGKVVTALAMLFEGQPAYEELYDLTERVLISREQKLAAADLRKERAVNLFRVGKYELAVRHLRIVKVDWYDKETLRGSLLSSWMLSECYSRLGLTYVAIEELFGILHIVTLDEDTLKEHSDLFVKGFTHLYYKYLQLGLIASSVIMAKLALLSRVKFNIETDSEITDDFYQILEKNTQLSLVLLGRNFPAFADKVAKIIEKPLPGVYETYKMFFKESDVEFEQGWEGEEDKLEDAKKFREQVRKGELPDFLGDEINEPVDESEKKQVRQFKYKEVEVELDFDNNFLNKRVSEHILSLLQVLFVSFFEDESLTWIETDIKIHILVEETDEVFIREKSGNDSVELDLVVSEKAVATLFSLPFDKLVDFERFLFSYLLTQCTIDSHKEIEKFLKGLDEKEFFKGLSGKVPLGLTMKTFFLDEDYEIISEGV